ncbi:MAG: CBS domain-containing protein [Clostridia bacterium]
MEKLTYSARFINAYNRLDKSLRDIYGLKSVLNFSDMIRKVAPINSVIKKYEDDIIDYGRLRNAIVHRSTDETIAEPHEEVVEKFESIVRQITTPPIAMSSIVTRKVYTIDSSEKLSNVLMEMFKQGYSNVPVYEDNKLIGVITRKMIVDCFGEGIVAGVSTDSIISMSVAESLNIYHATEHYEVVDKNITVDNLLYIFQQNRKLSCVIITESGSYSERPLGIVVTADTIDMQTILDNY